MLVKIHKSYRDVIAICDEDLIGKTFQENNFQLDIKESFYKGEIKDNLQISKIFQSGKTEDATFNIVGEESINAAINSGIVTKEGIKKIQGVPFALVLL